MEWLRARWKRLGTAVRAALAERSTPGRVASAIGLGVALGLAPLPGFQMVIAVALASVLKLNRILTLLGTNITFGPLLPAAFAAEIALGTKLLGRPLPDLSREHVLASARDAGIAWWLGFVVIGTPLALLFAGLAWLYAKRFTSRDATG